MSRMIAIASGKGGVGKTWLAITLGHALARLGLRVLVFDADLGLANVDVQLGFEPAKDLGQVLSGRAGLPDVVHRCEDTGFDVVLGRSGSGALARLDRARIDDLLRGLSGLAQGYDVTLLDLPAGIDHLVRAALGAASERLVVTTDEPTALTDAYALLKVGRQDRPDGHFALIINQAPGREAGQRTHEGLCRVCARFLGFAPPLTGIVRRDARVADAIRRQTPFLTRYPLAPAAEDIGVVAQALAGNR